MMYSPIVYDGFLLIKQPHEANVLLQQFARLKLHSNLENFIGYYFCKFRGRSIHGCKIHTLNKIVIKGNLKNEKLCSLEPTKMI
jgi:hypothetical protein